MPSSCYMRGNWSLYHQDDGAWTVQTSTDDGRIETFIAMRGPWPSRAEESIANGHLCKAAPKMYEALTTYLKSREMATQVIDGKMPADAIDQLKEIHRLFHEQAVDALAEADGL
jgi:hypothetical protein